MKLSRDEYKRRYLERQAWIDWVQARDDLTMTSRLVGGRLGLHKNLETGLCNPGAGTLADEAAIHERAAFRAIAELERKGCIKIERTRGGSQNNSNRYTLIAPDEAATGDTVSGVRTAKRTNVRGDNRGSRRVTLCQANNEENNIAEGEAKASPVRVERENAPTARDSISIGGAALRASPDLFEDQQADAPEIIPDAEIAAAPQRSARGEQTISAEPEIQTPNARQQEPSTPRDVVDIGDERAFRELRAIWNRGHPRDDLPREIAVARHAFAMACAVAEGGGEGIVAAAKAWREAADAPRFLTPLTVWLTTRSWAKPPPTKAKRVRAGGRAERSRYDKPSIASRLLAIAEREA